MELVRRGSDGAKQVLATGRHVEPHTHTYTFLLFLFFMSDTSYYFEVLLLPLNPPSTCAHKGEVPAHACPLRRAAMGLGFWPLGGRLKKGPHLVVAVLGLRRPTQSCLSRLYRTYPHPPLSRIKSGLPIRPLFHKGGPLLSSSLPSPFFSPFLSPFLPFFFLLSPFFSPFSSPRRRRTGGSIATGYLLVARKLLRDTDSKVPPPSSLTPSFRATSTLKS